MSQYLSYAMGDAQDGSLKTMAGAIRWRAQHADICNEACFFVWKATRPDVSENEIARFLPELKASQPVLSYNVIEKFYGSWTTRNLLVDLAQQPLPAEEPANLESLSDLEIARLWSASRLEAHQAAR